MLALILALIWSSTSTYDWLHGKMLNLYPADVGLSSMTINCERPLPLWNRCHTEDDTVGRTMCQIAAAGTTCFFLTWVSILVTILIALTIIAEALDEREMLGAIRAALPRSCTAERLGVLPMLFWAILYCLIFTTLLIYSLAVPSSLGSGGVHFGSGYGRQRLALLLTLISSVIHLTLVQRARITPSFPPKCHLSVLPTNLPHADW